MSKEKEMSEEQKRASIKEFDLKKGLLVATFSGVMSACFAYGLAAGDPIKELTIRHGTPPLWQGLPVLVVLLLGGFTTNFIWCAILNVRNRTMFGAYDRGYQNFVPGAVTTNKTGVALSAYNNATKRRNIFNQTDLTYLWSTGRVKHTLLAGSEVGRQLTDNFRNTGFFSNTAISIAVPYDNPTISLPVTFRQSANDTDNHLKTNLAATYAQDQIEFSRHVQIVAGLRFDYFDLQFHNKRNGGDLRRITYHDTASVVEDWSVDSQQIFFSSARDQQAVFRHRRPRRQRRQTADASFDLCELWRFLSAELR